MSKVFFTASPGSRIVQFYQPYLVVFRYLNWTVDAACGSVPIEIP